MRSSSRGKTTTQNRHTPLGRQEAVRSAWGSCLEILCSQQLAGSPFARHPRVCWPEQSSARVGRLRTFLGIASVEAFVHPHRQSRTHRLALRRRSRRRQRALKPMRGRPHLLFVLGAASPDQGDFFFEYEKCRSFRESFVFAKNLSLQNSNLVVTFVALVGRLH